MIAIGSPLGLEGTVTAGIVSALDRPVHVLGDDGDSPTPYLDAIQTDAAINPGNSGGALVDAQGAVIGINSAAGCSPADGANGTLPVSGIGYAIPIDYAREIALQLIKTGKAHARLARRAGPHRAGRAAGRAPTSSRSCPKGAAAKAGLRNGDVIIVADGKPILSYDQLVVIVQEHKPGDKIDVTYYRGAAKTDRRTRHARARRRVGPCSTSGRWSSWSSAIVAVIVSVPTGCPALARDAARHAADPARTRHRRAHPAARRARPGVRRPRPGRPAQPQPAHRAAARDPRRRRDRPARRPAQARPARGLPRCRPAHADARRDDDTTTSRSRCASRAERPLARGEQAPYDDDAT